jgi:hypothetical protein
MSRHGDIGDKKFVFVWSSSARTWRWERRGWLRDDAWLPAEKAPADRTEWRARLEDETELWMRENDPSYGNCSSSWSGTHSWRLTQYDLDPDFTEFQYERTEAVYVRVGIETTPDGRQVAIGTPVDARTGRPPKGGTKMGVGHVAVGVSHFFNRCGLRLEDALPKQKAGRPSKDAQPARDAIKVLFYVLDASGVGRKHFKTFASLSNSQVSMWITNATAVFPKVRPYFTQTVHKEDEVSEVLHEIKLLRRDVAEMKADVKDIKAELPELAQQFGERLRNSGYSDRDIIEAVDEFLAAA